MNVTGCLINRMSKEDIHMRKSKNVFLLMAVIYFAVAILGNTEYLTISENILLGLSLSALLSSISDILYNISSRRIAANELDYII